MSDQQLAWFKISDACYNIESFVPKNSMRTVIVKDKEYCVANLPDGLFAMNDYCPHAGASLGHGWCNEKGIVTCPLHNKKFDIHNGRCVFGDNFYRVKTHPVKIDEEGIFIGLPVDF